MRGHDTILKHRLSGWKPAMVWFTDLPPLAYEEVTVVYEPEDKPALSDLRFCVGLTVKVEGSDRQRIDAWVNAIKDAGAKRVLWVHHRMVGSPGYERCEIVAMGDTDGILGDAS